MTTQDAIKYMELYTADGASDYYKPEFVEAHKMAIFALKKQIPISPIPIGEYRTRFKCPSCLHMIPSGMGSSSRRRDNWCNYCGQRIDWEAENG